MELTVTWTQNALDDLENIAQYIFMEFGSVHAGKFHEKLRIRLKLLSEQPLIGTKTSKNEFIRKTHISKITILIYRYKPTKKTIEILQLWDGRRNQASMKK